MATVKAYLLLGSNLGNRQENLKKAIDFLTSWCGKVTAQSALYETEAWGLKEQPAFINQAIAIEAELPAQPLLSTIKRIEVEIGRSTGVKWGPRLIDIDILFYGDTIMNTEPLVIPHPHLHERRFTLTPLNEIAPDLIHPVLNKAVKALLAECPDKSQVVKL
ncbi:MAG: 2-amino-4-hydroxy-6-hydroxymethyldihydropteridine diphosphokinase [Chitinophagales bacterium]